MYQGGIGCLECRENDQLGFNLSAAIPVITSLLGSLNNPNNAARKASADQLYSAALAGDAVSEARLRLLSHVGTQSDIATMKAAGLDPQCIGDAPSGCGWATTWAQDYGKAKLAELAARRAAGQIGTTLIGQSNIPPTLIAGAKGLVTNPYVIGGAVLVAVLLISRRGRR